MEEVLAVLRSSQILREPIILLYTARERFHLPRVSAKLLQSLWQMRIQEHRLQAVLKFSHLSQR